MPFTVPNLLLTEEKAAQLTDALANTDVDDPLETCIAEASSDVARLTTGYVLDGNSVNGFVRAMALFKAYSLCGPVPEDIQTQYDNAIKELNSIARGERKNLAQVPAGGTTPSAGGWGSSKKICT